MGAVIPCVDLVVQNCREKLLRNVKKKGELCGEKE
jgi:hypothetical protein